MRDQMHYLPFALHAAMDRHHAGGENDPAPLLIEFWTDHQIGYTGFVLDGDEHGALRRARLLPHQDDTGGLQSLTILRLHRLRAGHDFPAAKFIP